MGRRDRWRIDGTVAERCCYCGVRRGTQQTGSTGAGGLANTVTLITKSGQIVQNRTKSELPGLGFGPVLGLGLGPVVTLFMSQSRQLVAVSCELPRIVWYAALRWRRVSDAGDVGQLLKVTRRSN